ncbi:unnamed protein product [Amoebophrya sp. A25]|nr:unnamed protein product [Amoebophrya sp. A25]|eukprot:GSA25T00025475001.1
MLFHRRRVFSICLWSLFTEHVSLVRAVNFPGPGGFLSLAEGTGPAVLFRQENAQFDRLVSQVLGYQKSYSCQKCTRSTSQPCDAQHFRTTGTFALAWEVFEKYLGTRTRTIGATTEDYLGKKSTPLVQPQSILSRETTRFSFSTPGGGYDTRSSSISSGSSDVDDQHRTGTDGIHFVPEVYLAHPDTTAEMKVPVLVRGPGETTIGSSIDNAKMRKIFRILDKFEPRLEDRDSNPKLNVLECFAILSAPQASTPDGTSNGREEDKMQQQQLSSSETSSNGTRKEDKPKRPPSFCGLRNEHSKGRERGPGCDFRSRLKGLVHQVQNQNRKTQSKRGFDKLGGSLAAVRPWLLHDPASSPPFYAFGKFIDLVVPEFASPVMLDFGKVWEIADFLARQALDYKLRNEKESPYNETRVEVMHDAVEALRWFAENQEELVKAKRLHYGQRDMDQATADFRKEFLECYGSDWYGPDWYGPDWYGSDWYGPDWYGTDWYGSYWYGPDWCGSLHGHSFFSLQDIIDVEQVVEEAGDESPVAPDVLGATLDEVPKEQITPTRPASNSIAVLKSGGRRPPLRGVPWADLHD